jgi:hypothetical protein
MSLEQVRGQVADARSDFGLFRIVQISEIPVVLIDNSQPAAVQIFLDGRDQ